MTAEMSGSEEFRLKIEAYTPETMPMARLAEYLAELALMLGESTSIHFVRLDSGSTSLVHRIDREALPKIRARTQSVGRGVGPRDAVRAYKKINRMLRDDNGRAVWNRDVAEPGPVIVPDIIVFPGTDDAEQGFEAVRQRGSLDGEVIRVGGSQKLIPVTLQSEHQEITGCWADRVIAKALAQRLFEPVRLFGTGRWNRNDEGTWKLGIFRVESFATLKPTSLSEALADLRTIEIEWSDEAFNELRLLRNDLAEETSGSV